MTRRHLCAALAVATLLPTPVSAQQEVPCLTGAPAPAVDGTFTIDVDRSYEFVINEAVANIQNRYAYLVVHRRNPDGEFVRLFERNKDRELVAVFGFSLAPERDSRAPASAPSVSYQIELRSSPVFEWPLKDGSGTHVQGCQFQDVIVRSGERRYDYEGTRGQWWLAFRFPAKGEVGASVFFGRAGLATTVEANFPRFVTKEGAPREPNRVSFSEEFRWRTSRGYLGAGLRYYPDEEPDHDQWRVTFVAGEELPSLKGLPIWMVINLTMDQWEAKFWKPLSFGFAFRFDMPGSRP